MARRQESETRAKTSGRGARQQSATADRETRDAGAEGERQQQGARADRERGLAVQRDDRSAAAARRDASRPTGSNPFEMMRRMTEDLDRLAQGFGLGRLGLLPLTGPGLDAFGGMQSAERSIWSPQVELFRRGDELVVRADLPGLEPGDVEVEVTNDNVLTITGERREQSEDRSEDGYYRSERSYGRFFRSIPLPEGVDADACQASFRNGVLEVTVPAPKQESRRRRIEVRG